MPFPQRARKKTVEEVHQEIMEVRSDPVDGPVEFLNTGSTPLNLAGSCKGENGGWARGRIVNIVGDGSSGKTLLALETMAWCLSNIKKIKSNLFPAVDEIVMDYINAEGVMDFPVAQMYGEKFFKAVNWLHFDTVESVGRYLFRTLNDYKSGVFRIAVIDSWDALDSEPELADFEKSITDDKPMEGSYDLGKQKYGSKRFFKRMASELHNNSKDFTLFIISQTREKIGVTFGKKKYRTGGAALDFYTHQVCWLYEKKHLTKTIDGLDRTYGINVVGRFERNKTAKPFREGNVTILFDYGVDDINSMIDFMWGEKKGPYSIEGLEKPFQHRNAFIDAIVKNNWQGKMAAMCEKRWMAVEAAIKEEMVNRPPKF
jgi:RecA/RadA recombinase